MTLTATEPAVSSTAPAEVEKPRRLHYSGFCGTGPCKDGRETNKVGEPIRRCRFYSVNGTKASTPYVVCSCSCHAEDALPDMTSVEAAWAAARTER